MFLLFLFLDDFLRTSSRTKMTLFNDYNIECEKAFQGSYSNWKLFFFFSSCLQRTCWTPWDHLTFRELLPRALKENLSTTLESYDLSGEGVTSSILRKLSFRRNFPPWQLILVSFPRSTKMVQESSFTLKPYTGVQAPP